MMQSLRAGALAALALLCLAGPALAVPEQFQASDGINQTPVSEANRLPVALGPSSASTAAITPVVTSVAASSLVAKASAGNLYSFHGSSTVSGWFLVFNATSAPVDGTVTPIASVDCLTANETCGLNYSEAPLRASTGLTIVFSTTGPFTKTASATAFISAEVQ